MHYHANAPPNILATFQSLPGPNLAENQIFLLMSIKGICYHSPWPNHGGEDALYLMRLGFLKGTNRAPGA